LLSEITNPPKAIGWNSPLEPGFDLRHFRPVVSDSDELGIEAQFYRAKSRKSKAPARESEPVE
jgi:hypothetical protein